MIKQFFMTIIHILLIPYYIVKMTIKGFKQQLSFFGRGFKTLSLFLSRGFYFYFAKFFTGLKKITRLEFLQKPINYFELRREEPSHIVLIIVWFLTLLFLFDSLYVDNNNMVKELPKEDITSKVAKEEVKKDTPKDNDLLSMDFNLYRMYGKYSLKDINITELKKKNPDTVAWIMVEGTSINYPIVQTDNNDYYLQRSFDRTYTYNGWTFMDFRNDSMLNDSNTIFYGHNLLNGTAFGSVRKIFDNAKKANKILVITADGEKHTYKVFSGYEIDPEIYYLQTNFDSLESYSSFLETIKNRSVLNISNEVSTDDKIITLSTCTDDNTGRKVIHAKLIS